jgi:polar amino acid transport system permease protein
MGLDFTVLIDYIPLFFKALVMTIGLSLVTVFFGTILGIPLATFRLSKNRVLHYIATAYIEVVRGTPVLLQLYIFAYGLPGAFPFIQLTPETAGVIALSLNSAAYVAEIIRSGIQSIDKGQFEAARCLGLNNRQTMVKIIIPQAVKNVLPALGNEFVAVVKESSIVSVVGVTEVMKITGVISANKFRIFEGLIFAAVLYFVVTFSISKIIALLERKFSQNGEH